MKAECGLGGQWEGTGIQIKWGSPHSLQILLPEIPPDTKSEKGENLERVQFDAGLQAWRSRRAEGTRNSTWILFSISPTGERL